MIRNPWITETQDDAPPQGAAVASTEDEKAAGAGVRPQVGSVPAVDAADRLEARVLSSAAAGGLFVLGVHGGAGESTLAAWLDAQPCGRAWPTSPGVRPRVLLVARTHARGLEASRRAATEWASGSIPVEVLGLVLIGDAPGRQLPKALRAQVRQLAGALPRTWTIPFLPALREIPEPEAAPPSAVVRTIRQITSTTTTKEN